MKSKLMRMLSLVLMIAMLATLFVGCGDNGNTDNTKGTGGAGTNPDAVTVTMLVPSDFENHIRQAMEVFKELHPEINVELIFGSEEAANMPSELSTLAAGEKLPDVAFGVENFAYILSQGLAYPLDNLYAADPDKEDALQAGINNYTYNGHLYALPFRVQFNGIMVNLDLIQTLNLDEPYYDWTIDEFIDLAKKATDNQHSGINIVTATDDTHELQTKLMGAMMDAPFQMYGYNMDTHEFDFTSGAWTKAQEYINELRSVPGLISDELKEWDKRNNGIPDAYDNKFGGSADAMVAGKVLFGNHNSWETYWMVKKCNFEWDLYPVPHADGVSERIQTHVDYAFLTPAVTEENAQAAYEVIKFLSYSKEGCLARMAITDEGVAANDYTAFYMERYLTMSEEGVKAMLGEFEAGELLFESVELFLDKEAIFDCEKDGAYILDADIASNGSQLSQNTAIFYANGEYITSFTVAGANGQITENRKRIVLAAGENLITVKYPREALSIPKIRIYSEK